LSSCYLSGKAETSCVATARAHTVRMRCRKASCRRPRNFRLLAHNKNRTFGIAHHVSGVGAEEVRAHRRAMRTHHDQIRVECLRFLEHFVVNAALAHSRGNTRGIKAALMRDNAAASRLHSCAIMPSASSADLRCCTSKSGGTYSASITGVMARTLTRRPAPPDVRTISIAVVMAGLVRSVSARSTGTRTFLYMTAPLISLRGYN